MSEPNTRRDTEERVPDPDAEAQARGQSSDAAAAGKTLDELLAEAQSKIEQQRDAWLRAVAETDNVRKRAQQDVENAHKFAVERLAESLLPVADALEATLVAEGADLAALRSGVELTLKQLRAALDKASVSDIVPAAGEKFDPHRHQAMAAVESDAEPNTVLQVLQKGWRLHERVIRPALVTVAKPKAEKSEGPDT
jgi:molecular chaperone GrpE